MRGSLPLEQLPGRDAQPLGRLAVAWIPTGMAAALALAAGTRLSRDARAAGVGVVAWLLLVLTGPASDAVATATSVASDLAPQLTRAGTWAATGLLVIGTLLVRRTTR